MAKYFRSTLTNRQQKNLSFIFRCAFFLRFPYPKCTVLCVMLYHSDLPLLPVADAMANVIVVAYFPPLCCRCRLSLHFHCSTRYFRFTRTALAVTVFHFNLFLLPLFFPGKTVSISFFIRLCSPHFLSALD